VRRTRRQQQRQLTQQRAQTLARRRQEDAAWEAACRDRRARLRPAHWTPTDWPAFVAAEDQWLLLRTQRQATLAQRPQEDAQWRADQERLQAPLALPSTRSPWVAILGLTDNCSRQCLGLPLFAAGPTVTAEVIVAALRTLRPAQLQVLISDRGTHFTAQPFVRFADEHGCVHVLVARHRPQSNGIAERFVRTLKEWLAGQTWTGADALGPLLCRFRREYNDRPHQGLPLPGLSPDEFARRLWLL
jgi:transposase InsO family protein